MLSTEEGLIQGQGEVRLGLATHRALAIAEAIQAACFGLPTLNPCEELPVRLSWGRPIRMCLCSMPCRLRQRVGLGFTRADAMEL